MSHLQEKFITSPKETLFQRIEESDSRSIPFSEFMETALYHDEGGYYAKPWERRPGREGDFFTSVSVGETFGFLLACAIRARFPEGRPFLVVEQGGHDGQLARDITAALDSGPGDDFTGYYLVEPRKAIRDFLRADLESRDLGNRIRPVASVAEIEAGIPGVFLANELLDAFPVDRLVFEEGRWRELRVTVHGGEFAWQPGGEVDPGDLPACLPGDCTEGYVTEICPGLDEWAAGLADLFGEEGSAGDGGFAWIIDYGFEEAEYFAPHRVTGTLQCYRGHHRTENPFEAVGETDITAHVNFSHLDRALEERAGFRLLRRDDQYRFLVRAAESWLREMDGREPSPGEAARLRQFQTLTHPSLMGRCFQVAEYGKIGYKSGLDETR